MNQYTTRDRVVQSNTIAVSSHLEMFSTLTCSHSPSVATDYANSVAHTTRRPAIMSTLYGGAQSMSGCSHNGRMYDDGAPVKSKNKCEHCYCMRNEVVCAVQECSVPCEGCVPVWGDEDTCCPEKYECCKLMIRMIW